MYGYIYKTTNLINGKIYVGKHKASQFNPDYKGSGKLITRAINKYGEANFKTIMLCTCNDLVELNNTEKKYILELNSNYLTGCGYNISPGGDGGPTTLNTVMMHNEDTVKFVYPDEVVYYESIHYVKGQLAHVKEVLSKKQKLRTGINCSFYGKHHTPESKRKIGLASKGRTGLGDDNIAKRPEVRAKISRYALTHKNYFRDHKFYYVTDGDVEIKLLITEPVPEGFVKGRLPHRWVHDNDHEYCILASDLNKYLSEGKQLGRLPKK